MRARRWLLAAIPTLLFGCGSTSGAKVDDAKLGRLPADDKQSIFSAQRNVDIAESNLSAARVAKDEAQQFQKVSSAELDAAKSQLEAARSGIDLGKQARSQSTLSAAQAQEDQQRKHLVAAQAKKDYAERLVTLRDVKVQENEAAVAVAKSEVETTKVQALKKNDMMGGVEEAKFAEARRKAQDDLANKRLKSSQLEGEVASLRSAWEERRRDFNTASRETEPSIKAPPAPTPTPLPGNLTEPSSRSFDRAAPANPPAPGVNEGPSYPSSTPSR